MKTHTSRSLAAMLGLALSLNCGGPQTHPEPAHSPSPSPEPVASATPTPTAPPETPDAPFRQHSPEPAATRPFTPPHIETFALANHLAVYLVERHELPIVVTEFVTRHGADDVPVAQAGVASLVGALLESGTTTRNALELSDAFAAIGAEHATFLGWDGGGGYVKVLSRNVEPAIALLAEVIEHPAFAADEIERARTRRLASLQQELDSPRTIAANVAARTVYGDTHPYGRTLTGNEAAIRAMTRAEVQRVYQTHFVPGDGALLVVGDVTRATVTPLLEHAFGTWHARGTAVRPVPAPPAAAPGPRLVLVDRHGAPQSAVSVTHVGVARSSSDYPAIVVMNTILGGMFSSRINLNLREAHAYTYGAGSVFSMRHGAGPFLIGGAIITASTAPAVHEILSELNRIRSEDVLADELTLAKARITESLPARFETGDQTAGAVSDIFLYGLPLNEYETIAQRINAVTAADVRRVATQYLDPDHARIIVVGDREAIEPGLRELGLGDVLVVDPRGERPTASGAPSASPAPSAARHDAHAPTAHHHTAH